MKSITGTIAGPPTVVCGLMVVVAVIAARTADLQFAGIIIPYFSLVMAITFICSLGFIFIEVAKLARQGADHPLIRVRTAFLQRAPLLILPVVVLPVFLIGYTTAKSAIPFLVGYTWDSFWANTDKLIFGDDAWRLTRRFLGLTFPPVWEWFYTVVWGGVFFFSASIVALCAKPRTVGIFFTAMFATWFVGGCVFAYSFSAAGPVFAGLFNHSLDLRFEPLRDILENSLGDGPIGSTQRYLSRAVDSHVVVKGGGISAMPSMHLGAVTVYVFASRRTIWFLPACVLWLVIFVASGYFGYHYWIDGLVAALIAWICWRGAETCYVTGRPGRSAMGRRIA